MTFELTACFTSGAIRATSRDPSRSGSFAQAVAQQPPKTYAQKDHRGFDDQDQPYGAQEPGSRRPYSRRILPRRGCGREFIDLHLGLRLRCAGGIGMHWRTAAATHVAILSLRVAPASLAETAIICPFLTK